MKNIIINSNNRFKSVFVSANFLLTLDSKMASKNALLAMILKKSNSKYKTEKDLERKLAKLYDTSIDVNVEKITGLYNISFGIEFLNTSYMTKENVDEAIDVIYSVICRPNIVEGLFDNATFEREKIALIQKIEEQRDDKRKYALNRLEQEMFKGTPFATQVFGTAEEVQEITLEEISKHYSYVVNTAKVLVTVTGNVVGLEDIGKNLYNLICEKCGQHEVIQAQNVNDSTRNIVTTIESQDVNQSILCIGARINNITKKDMYKAMVYDVILGGTPAAKLFQNVREKESLAYFAKSIYKRYTNSICMYAGIAPDKYEKTKSVMLEQLEILKQGIISNEEFEAAKGNLITTYKQLQDSKEAQSMLILANELFFGEQVSFDDMIKHISEVKLDDVVEIAKKVVVTNIFLLGGAINA